ncbi:MAG: helicase-exonuclease AddAB subunit AddA [Oscillospiraceae bacterium]|nr:helicase-exonuclease AddAB subunit AddA [Oscillospiraceae bacterium]
MAEIKLTPEQQLVTECYGGPLLVSAAAGSGKTRVLVERLLKRVCDGDGSVDVDDFLIITFTNAAASELRSKILDAIYDRIALDPDNRRLRYEAEVCARAQISTIHSFCSQVIRENAHILGLNPAFRVADELETNAIKNDVLNNIIEDAYSTGSAEFLALADTMGSGRDDSKLQEVVLETYSALMSHPYPEDWVRVQLEAFGKDYSDAAETVWGKVLIDKLTAWINYNIPKLQEAINEGEKIEPFWKKYGATLTEAYNWAIAVREGAAKGWDSAREALSVTFSRAGTVSGYDDLKKPRNDLKDESVKYKKLFSESSEQSLSDLKATYPIVEGLLGLVMRFREAYDAEKRRRGVIDFNDQEHLALSLLIDRDTMAPTELAGKISRRFAEIMVDEYQDVNAVQELIFSAVSKGDNLFMVGDVKQSIYRFRLADPTIFLGKYHSYKYAAEALDGDGRKIILQRNFRSREGILNAVNFVFRAIMSEELGDMDYSDDEALYAGAIYPESDSPQVELDLIDLNSDDDDSEEDPDKIRTEAAFGAQRILELMGSGKVSDGQGGLRRPEYRDFAILMRSKNRTAVWVEELNARNIPVSIESETDFFTSPEISIAMSLMAVIDNPRQDIPLVSVLRSPIYGFSSDELGEIRARKKDSDLFAAVLESAEVNEKCARVISDIDKFRYLAPDLPTDEFLWRLFDDLGFFACVSAMPGGFKRRENLMTLLDSAKRFEAQGCRGLFSFVRYMERLAEKGQAPVSREGKSSENAVTIMSIHKSKGLEFPIVILADTAHQFNTEDLKKQLLIHKELGVGPKRVDLERRMEYPTLPRKALTERARHEALSEEMRVLYVAMTRAREKLIMLATYSDAKKIVDKYVSIPLPASALVLEGAKSFAEWIICAALHRPEAESIRFGNTTIPCSDGDTWDIRLVRESDVYSDEADEMVYASDKLSSDDVRELSERLSWHYDHTESQSLPSKITATELKGTSLISETHEDAGELNAPHRYLNPPTRPEFTGKRGLTAAQIGTAHHLVMQYCDYKKCSTLEGVKSEIARLRAIGNLSEEEANAVDPNVILGFFNSDIGKELVGADKIWRELKFSTLVPSDRVFGKGDDDILLQGVVDCMFEKGGALIVIDFKTDSVTDESAKKRAGEYRGQLDAYSYAMEKIMHRKVERRVLFFLRKGISVSL